MLGLRIFLSISPSLYLSVSYRSHSDDTAKIVICAVDGLKKDRQEHYESLNILLGVH